MQCDEDEERLYYALEFNDAALLKIFLREGINVNMTFEGTNQLGKSALHLCCEKGSYQCAELLLKHGAFMNALDKWHQTPLMYAVCTERDDMVQLLISSGCDLNVRDRHGKSALQHAVSNTGTVCLCQLIDAGANPDAGDSLGCTPLWHAACTDGCLLPLQKLIAAGASVNVRDAREKRIPLQACLIHTKRDTLTFVKLLLQASSDLDTFDHYGNTLLMTVIKRNKQDGCLVSPEDLELMRCILKAGHNVNLVHQRHYWFQFGGTALKMAAERGAVDIVSLLLQYRANPNLTDDKCTMPLLSAVRHNHADVCQLLLAANCDTDVAGEVTINDDYVTVTPLRCAVLFSHWQCAQLLVCAGCDLSSEHYLWDQRDVPVTLMNNLEFWSWLDNVRCTPRSLQFLCRRLFRHQLGIDIVAKLDTMMVPKMLKDYLLQPAIPL